MNKSKFFASLAFAFVVIAVASSFQQPMGQINVVTAGCVADGKTDCTVILNNLFSTSPEGSCFYFPQGQYLVSAPLVLNNHKNFSMTGDCMMSGGNQGSTIIGNVPGNLVSANNGSSQTFQISKLNFVNSNPAATSTAFYSSNAICSSLRDCSFAGSNGLWLNSPFSTTVDTPHFNGWGSKVSVGTGLTVTGSTNTVLIDPDFMGWNYAAKLTGNSISCVGVRCEVNHVGLALGVNPDGTQGFLNRIAFTGGGMEANDIGILAQNVSGGVIKGIGVQGSTNAPAGLSVMGFQAHATNGITVDGCDMSGAYSGAAWQVGDPVGSNALLQHTHFQSCVGNNGGSGKVVWNVTSPGCTWADCDFRCDNHQDSKVPANASSVVVQLLCPQNQGAYSVFLTPNWQTTCWVSNKTSASFQFNCVPSPNPQTFDWQIK